MNRGRQLKDSRNISGIPQGRQRSSSIDVMSRGSYLPPKRRSASTEYKGSAIKQPFRSTEKKGSFGNSFSKLSVGNPFLKGSRGNSFQRGSSLSKKGPVKDPRPLTDKSYQKHCIHELVDFLEAHNFQYIISRANLLLPTRKDFESIFQFLYQFWDPKYEVQKIEDEIPKIMKSLNYPFAVTKSSLVSITRMSWPSLLGVLMWLLDLNKCCSSISVGQYFHSDVDFDAPNEQSILLDYICHSFEAQVYNPEKENNPEKERGLFSMLIRKKHDADFDVEQCMKKNHELKELIRKEFKEHEEYDKLVQQNKQAEADIVVYQGHINNLKNHIEHKTTIYEQKKAENAEKMDQLNALKAESARLEVLYKNQGFDGMQAQNFYQSQIESLNQELVQSNRDGVVEEKKFWDLEIEYANLTHNAQTQCTNFCRMWEQLCNKVHSVLPEALKNTKVPAAKKLSRDYKVDLPNFEFHSKFTDDIRPVLEYAIKYIEEQRKNVQNIMQSQDNHIHQMKLKMSETDVKHGLFSAKFKQKEHELEMKAKENLQKLDQLKQKSQILGKETADVRAKRKSIEDRLQELKNSRGEMNKKIELKEKELLIYQTQGASTLKDVENGFRESCQNFEAMKEMMVNQMMAHITFIKENSLPQ